MMITCGLLHLIRIEAERAGAAGDHQANVAVLDAVDADRLVDGFAHLSGVIGIVSQIALADSYRRSMCSSRRKTLPL